jgi:tetratricopeptide (TPR) repeat protein
VAGRDDQDLLADAATVPAAGDRAGSLDAATAPIRADAQGAGGPTVGATWDRYVLEAPIGAGGMGAVWRAYDPELERQVALKVLHDDALGRASQERLRREARAIARVAHACVVPVYDVGEHAGRSYYTMELIRGASVRAWLATPRGWPEVVRVFADAARGLAAIHAAGLAHRDIKPGNLLLGDDGRCRVADLGIAMSALDGAPDGDAPLLGSTTLRLAGTPAYMAPEQLDGAPGDAASDQFAFGLTLWEALHGRMPFEGETVRARRATMRTPPIATRKIPPWLDTAVRRMLATAPADRFASMAAVAAALVPPRPRRWPWLVAAAIAITGAGAALALWPAAPQAVAPLVPCGQAGHDFDGAWSPAIGRALLARLSAGTGVSPETLTQALDEQVRAWSTAAWTACQRGAAGAWSSTTDARASACLAERAHGLRRVLDAGTLDELHDRLDHVGAARRCLDPAFLATLRLPSADPVATARLVPFIATHGFAYNLSGAGAGALALQVLDRMGPLPTDASAGPLRAQVAELRGLAVRDRDPAGAWAHYEEAYYLSRATGDDGATARAAGTLITEGTQLLSDRARAEQWLKIALADAERDPEMDQVDDIYLAAAGYYLAVGDFTVAIDWARRATEADAAHFGPGHLRNDSALGMLASAYDLSGRPAEAIPIYERQLALLADWYGDGAARLDEARMNLALACSGLGQHDRAVDLAQGVIRAMLARGAPAPRPYGIDLLNLGVVLSNAHRFADAIAPLAHAVEVLRAIDGPTHPDVALAAVDLAYARSELVDDHDTAGLTQVLAEERAALALARAANGPDHPETASGEQNVAVTLYRLGRCAEAEPLAAHVHASFVRAGDKVGAGNPLELEGDCARRARDWPRAVAAYRATIEAFAGGDARERSEARRRLAIALLGAGDRAGAQAAMTARRAEVDSDAARAEIDAWLAHPVGDPP